MSTFFTIGAPQLCGPESVYALHGVFITQCDANGRERLSI